jgi:hypothetical protein
VSLPAFVGLLLRSSAAAPVAAELVPAELVLAGLGEEATDGCSVLQMRLDGVGSLDLAAAFMRSASSMTLARD